MEDRIDPRDSEIGTPMSLKIQFGKDGFDVNPQLDGKTINEAYSFRLTGAAAEEEPVLLTIKQWRFEDKDDYTHIYTDKTVFEIEGGDLTTKATLKKIIKGRKVLNSGK